MVTVTVPSKRILESPRTPLDVVSLLYRLGVTSSIEDRMKRFSDLIPFDTINVSGLGICIGLLPDRIRKKLSKFEKSGKIVFFENTPVKELVKFKDYVFFLVNQINEKHIEGDVGVLYFTLNGPSVRLKNYFTAWKVYSGKVTRGNCTAELNWLIYVPTYDDNSYLFLHHPEDSSKPIVDKRGRHLRVNLVKNMVTAYIQQKISRIYETNMTPLFSC